MMLLSLAAVFVTVLLIMAHYETSSAGSFCNIDDYWNCDRVNKSVFAEIFGVPVAILGFLYYAFLSLVTFLLWRGKNPLAWFPKANASLVLKLALAGAGLGLLIMTILEFRLLGQNFWIAALKLLVMGGLYIWTYRAAWMTGDHNVRLAGALTILALFGVVFSLYLTDIELFVLHAICVYCFTQQILIVIIAALGGFALKTNINDLKRSQSDGLH